MHLHHQSLSSPPEINPTNETDVEMTESPAEALRTSPMHTGRSSPPLAYLRMSYKTTTSNRPPSITAVVTSTSSASSQHDAPTTSNSPTNVDSNMEAVDIDNNNELNDVRAKIEYDEDSSSQQQRITPATPQSPFATLETETEEDLSSAMKISSSPSSILPKLRLNALLASDPALKPDAKDLEAMHEETQQTKKRSAVHHIPPPSILSKKEKLDALLPGASGILVETTLKQTSSAAAAADLPPRLKVFMCLPCGIGFSSPSTLEAHQAYYCSHR